MNAIKIGSVIRELRKEKNMTQKELADLLHITDKAVSKWERGLCAPDISLLEPLSKLLDTSISALIGGERTIMDEHIEAAETAAKSVIDYSKKEIDYKTKSIKRQYLTAAAAGIVLALSICFFALWRMGYFSILDKSASPDGNSTVTVYGRDIFSGNIFRAPTVAVLVKKRDAGELRITYGNCAYQGLWWAPDGKKYVIALTYKDGTHLALSWLERNAESNLNAYLSTGVAMNELAEYGLPYDEDNARLEIEYQFLQWSLDSSAMLVYYSFTDIKGEFHSGYFWYNCENGKVYAPFELYSRD